MPKFEVQLGRLVRETASVVVEASSKKELESRLNEVYEAYEGDGWNPDIEWGCEESDSHFIMGKAKPRSKVQVTLKKGK